MQTSAPPAITHRDLAVVTARGRPFSAPGWIFELKYDGFRALASNLGRPRLVSRNGKDLGQAFPEIIEALDRLPGMAVDGELAILDPTGHPQFDRLRRRGAMSAARSIAAARAAEPAVLFAFDLLVHQGRDVRAQPLLKRKVALQKAVAGVERIQYLAHVGEEGERLYAAVDELGLEGIVAKRADSAYSRGRSAGWLKIKTPHGRHVDAERAKWNR